jgi:glycosyltransferase involved in cell wall biosynthesis
MNDTASRIWRVLPHLKHFNKVFNWDIKARPSNKVKPEELRWADAIILQMVFDKRAYDYARDNKKKTIFEIDDMVEWVPKDHYARNITFNPVRIYQFFMAVRRADAVIVSSPYLKKRYDWIRFRKRPVDVLPNCIDLDFWEKKYNENYSDQIRIGYAGGNSHVNDLKIVVPALKRILKEYPRTKFIYCGTGGMTSDNPMTEYNYGEDLFKDIPVNRREYVLGSNMEVYPDKLSSLQFDIALAPVIENPFTKAKTPIKWMEYGINRVPTVCTKFLYDQVVTNGVTGFLAETEEDWYQGIKKLVESRSLRHRIGSNAYKSVKKKHDLKKNLHKWEKVYQEIIN